jgi:hypothetical protein
MKKSNSPSGPSVSYEDLIQARAEEITARIDLKKLAPPYRTKKHKAELHESHIISQRERFNEWETLGNFYADVLENPDTPAEIHNAISSELEELANRAGLSITSPAVLRLVYSWLRDRLFEKEAGRV